MPANSQQNICNFVTNIVNMMIIDNHGIVHEEVACPFKTTSSDYCPPTKITKWEEKIIFSIWMDQVERSSGGLSTIIECSSSAQNLEMESGPVANVPPGASVPDEGAIRFICTVLVYSLKIGMKIGVPVIAVDCGVGFVRKKPSLTSRLWKNVFHKKHEKHVLAPKQEEKKYQCVITEPEPPKNPPHWTSYLL